jgi:uncharacterized protein (TIGR03435 family)
LACSLLALVAVPALAQVPAKTPAFEVTSVKPCPAQAEASRGSRRGDGHDSSPDRLHLPCQTLLSLIQWAYVNFADARFNPLAQVDSISGGPTWVNSELFEIDAKAEMPQSWGILNGPMLRSLLLERFHLKIRKETKEVSVYAITVAKGGAKLETSRGDCVAIDPEHPAIPIEPHKPLPAVCGMSRLTGKGWEAFAVTMDEFATLLSTNADRKVVDRTGLPGRFDIRLDLTADDLGLSSRRDDSGQIVSRPEQPEIFPIIRSAVQKLGLRIDSARGSGESFVIDGAERPAEN